MILPLKTGYHNKTAEFHSYENNNTKQNHFDKYEIITNMGPSFCFCDLQCFKKKLSVNDIVYE